MRFARTLLALAVLGATLHLYPVAMRAQQVPLSLVLLLLVLATVIGALWAIEGWLVAPPRQSPFRPLTLPERRRLARLNRLPMSRRRADYLRSFLR